MKQLKFVITTVIFFTLVFTSVFARAAEQCKIESWTALGVLIAKAPGEPLKIIHTNWPNFGSADLCWKAVKKYSHSDESIGKGGTDNRVSGIEWNFDGDCSMTCGDHNIADELLRTAKTRSPK